MCIEKKIDVVFFERPLVDLKRYAFRIANCLKRIDKSLVLASISLELPVSQSETDIDYCFLQKNIKDIDSFLICHSVKMIVFTNPRIPDMEMILHAHRNGIKTVMIQEGVIFEGANINDVNASNIFSLLKFIPKTVSYFNILHRMCRYENRQFLGLLKKLLVERRNITRIVAHYFKPYLIGDYVLTMGDYWEDYYHNTMKYPKDRIRVMGDHDLDGFRVGCEKEKAICYIATVLVEDGSRSEKEFGVFIDALSNCIDKETKLYVKLHPRSNIALYEKLKDHNISFVHERELPSSTVYIGHRSTLLARALYESDNLIIWKFKNEREDFFEKYASFVVSSEEELINACNTVDINCCTNNKKKEIETIYWLNPAGAIQTAAEMINQYIKTGVIQ